MNNKGKLSFKEKQKYHHDDKNFRMNRFLYDEMIKFLLNVTKNRIKGDNWMNRGLKYPTIKNFINRAVINLLEKEGINIRKIMEENKIKIMPSFSSNLLNSLQKEENDKKTS